MCRRGVARLKRYLNSTGSTGAPATNAPVEKASRQCAGLVVPSGATMNSGYLQRCPVSWPPHDARRDSKAAQITSSSHASDCCRVP